MVDVGQEAPDFTLRNHTEEKFSLSRFRGEKNVVLSWHVLCFTGQ